MYKIHIPGNFAHMQPVPGAIDELYVLTQLFDNYVLSTARRANLTV